MKKTVKQAYKQAPWRIQIQRFGFIALALVGGTIIAFLYLNISAQSATAGIKIQQLESKRANLENENASLLTEWARLTTAIEMEKRALASGYQLVDPEDIIYIVVEGYTGKELPEIETVSSVIGSTSPIIKPSYTQSLWEWFYEYILIPDSNLKVLP
ncbi:MAG TPA: hypothetical protein PLI60_04300 [Anaerolineaceae bacterium]|nr:hypothetical protein [Anaerolineaceae bacterium]HQN05244.1 hypothetical protein [Anaerolineaceae bacterium]HQP07927.1 hypothetical protein [Anaerolineaceae bacterium]